MNKKVERIKYLTVYLNNCRNSYYNNSESLISDKEYDELFDELSKLENETDVIMANSPTQTVGCEVKSKLEKTTHSHPMLSLDKTKSIEDLKKFLDDKDGLLMHKLDGLTILLTYDDGILIKAETRGNGEIGEDVTHNAKQFYNIPLQIEYKKHLELEGEAIITYDDFERINTELPEDKRYKNPRNLVSGSVRQLDSSIAAKRHIKFLVWKVPSIKLQKDTMYFRLKFAQKLGFDTVPMWRINIVDLEDCIEKLKEGFIESFVDIYELKAGFYDDIVKLDGFGEKSTDKLMDAIEKSKTTTLDRFIYSLSIPLVGRTASKDISKFFDGNFDKFIKDVLLQDFTQLDNFGDALDSSIHTYFHDHIDDVIELSEYFTFEKADKNNTGKDLSGITFVITGSLNIFKNREEAIKEIESVGGKVSGSVSAKTNYLVNNDVNSTSGKNKKAKELGIPIINEKQLVEMIR